MSIVAFNFTKIAAERKSGQISNVKINTNTSIKDVKEVTLGSQKAMLFTFVHVSKYEPAVASISIEGDVLVMSSEKEVKDTVAQFAKNKTLNPELTQKVYNAILTRANVQALVMAKELNLPAPFKLPRLEVKTQAKSGVEATPAAAPASKPTKKK